MSFDDLSWLVPYAPWIGAGLAFASLLVGLKINARRRLVDAIPTSKTAGVFIGLAEVKGTAECEQPLTSRLTGATCVQYVWKVEEKWTKTSTVTKTDGKGNQTKETKQTSGWTTVAQGGESGPFYLRDDTGVIRVVPDEARIEGDTVLSKTCDRSDPLYYGKGPEKAIAHSDHRRRFTETVVPLHGNVYVIGQAHERQDVVAPEIAADRHAPIFLISTRTEEQIRRGMTWQFWLLLFIGAVCAVGGFMVRHHAIHDALGPVWHYLAAAAVYGLVAVLGWLWMVFNSLIGLRQRVNQGWAQIESELKRRHDLIPQLVNVVAGFKTHEAEVQSQLAALRTETAATPPGSEGADPHGCASHVRALVEAYPDLKTSEMFRKLNDELVRTEQRVALARDYFNQIATHFNTRIEVVPDRLVAVLAGMKARPLLAAADFERAPVTVKLAT